MARRRVARTSRAATARRRRSTACRAWEVPGRLVSSKPGARRTGLAGGATRGMASGRAGGETAMNGVSRVEDEGEGKTVINSKFKIPV